MAKLVGKNLPRKEGPAKVTGRARYVDDLRLPGMLHGVTVRSQIPRGRIRGIRYTGDLPWDEIVVVTAADIPGKNYVALIENDQPYLVEERINHAEEPIVLLAHADRDILELARRHVVVDVDEEPAVLTLDSALARDQIIWSSDNVFKKYEIKQGDVDAAMKRAHKVVSGEYETGAQEQLYIETNGAMAQVDGSGVTVWGSMQCPYYVHKALVALFGLPPEKIRVIQAETGGGFGGKEEYPSMLSGHAALLAMKAKRPVKMIYDRAEDMAATTKRHPSRSRYRAAVNADGTLDALDIDFVLDGGAYLTLSPVVLSRGTLHAAGPYRIPNVRIRSRALATNTPPHGAFRGFGAPQSLFALERFMNKIATELDLAPELIRERNFLKTGERMPTGGLVKEKIALARLMNRALKAAKFHEKRRAFKKANVTSSTKRGMGFATFLHGAGFTGSGEERLASIVGCEATAEGRVRVLTANTEIGQGTNTIFSQIASDALGLPYDMVEVAQPDTHQVPNSGPTVASRTCMIVGRLVERAALGVRDILVGGGYLKAKHTPKAFAAACKKYVAEHGSLKHYAHYQAPPGVKWDDDSYTGDAYGTYAWATYVAAVAVDTVTGEARVEDFVALQEVGKVVHPILAAGQIEGGVAQGIGYAIYEHVVWRDGRMANNRMTNYIMPTAADLPPIRVFFEERPYAYGPAGAKGIGELPMDGPAPAILNAIEDATGVAFDAIPLMPETILARLSG